MRYRVNPNWADAMKRNIDLYLGTERITPEPVISGYSQAIKWYIEYLSNKNIGCKVVNLGAGVKKVIIDSNVCPYCNGKGTIK